jgi:hypothetical protein
MWWSSGTRERESLGMLVALDYSIERLWCQEAPILSVEGMGKNRDYPCR